MMVELGNLYGVLFIVIYISLLDFGWVEKRILLRRIIKDECWMDGCWMDVG